MKNENVKILKTTLSIPCHAINHEACSRYQYSGESAIWENEWKNARRLSLRADVSYFLPPAEKHFPRIPEKQQDTGTGLATPFRRRPFSAGGRK